MDANGSRFWMLSQSGDWMPQWRAVTAYIAGQGVVDPSGNIQLAQNSGTSDAVPPNWGTAASQTVVDGGLTWINAGPTVWAADTSFWEGQFVLDGNGNLQRATHILGNGTTGTSEPAWPRGVGDAVSDTNVTWVCCGPRQQGLFYCPRSNRLQLRSVRTGSPAVEDFNLATQLVESVPMTLDRFGNYARFDAGTNLVRAGGSGTGEVTIFAPGQPGLSDLAMGHDGVLYVALAGSLVMIDRRRRWENFTLAVPDFAFWRLVALPEGGVLALDRKHAQVGMVAGMPLQTGPLDLTNSGVLQPCQANANPPRIVGRFGLPATETFVGIAPVDPSASPMQFALLSWAVNAPTNDTAWLRICTAKGLEGSALKLGGARLPYSAAWIGEQQFAVLTTNLNEALIYDLADSSETLAAAGESYILSAANAGPFVHGFDLPPNYANAAGATPLMAPLLPLSLNSFSGSGAAGPVNPSIVDSGGAQTVWHRMFIEAKVPAKCGAIFWLAASDKLSDLVDAGCAWYPHVLGDADTASIPARMAGSVPTAVWQPIATEVPYAPTLLGAPPAQPTQGLYMVLVQRANTAVRNLTGRFLGVRVQLNGTGRSTPEIAGVRIYAPRFSYVKNYLPEIYREDTFGPDADVRGDSTRRDFLERFTALFESQFTRIEDRVANAYLLMRPESSPDDSLGWLGSWIGIEPDSYPPDRRRERLQAAPELYRRRGTVGGVRLALDVATNGQCRRGAIIVIENFRLRHIFATILGADLSIKNDPLLPGYSGSSNSIVGESLFLGDPAIQAELQALFSKDLGLAGSAAAVASFYDSLAHRMTVFVHDQVENVSFPLVGKIAEAEKPAHVQLTVMRASQAFMIGLASLVGVNTYLGPTPQRKPVRVDVSQVGRYDVVQEMATLDPRTENGPDIAEAASPIASIAGPGVISAGGVIVLDGSASTSPPGTSVESYRWTLIQH